MSESSGSRRIAAEIRFDDDRSGIDQVGSHSIHHYWHLIAPHFRDVLMSPQRRYDDGGVAWNWRESGESRPASVSELTEVRRKLTEANRAFAEGPDGSDEAVEGNALSTLEQVRERMDRITVALASKPDAELRAFVGRTESGLMVHSWGASTPAQPYNPDAHECEISGTVIVGEERAAGYEVVLENRKGVRIARQVSEGKEGSFVFPKIGPGEYRVRVVSDRVRFPLSGLTVTIERSSATGLELRSTSTPDTPPKPEPEVPEAVPEAGLKTEPISVEKMDTPAPKPKRRRLVWVGLALLLVLVGVYVARNRKSPLSESAEVSRTSSLASVPPAAEKTNLQHDSANSGMNRGTAGNEALNQRPERNRAVASAPSGGERAKTAVASPRGSGVAKASDFDGFDLPSDSTSSAKPKTIQGPSGAVAAGLNSPSVSGGTSEGGLDSGTNTGSGDMAGSGQSSADKAGPPISSGKGTASSPPKANPSASSAITTLEKKPNGGNDPATLASGSEEAKSDQTDKSAPSPTPAVAPPAASAPSSPKAETPEALPPASDAEKEKENQANKLDAPVPVKKAERKKPPAIPPPPKPAATSPSAGLPLASSANTMPTASPETPQLKPSATRSTNENSVARAEADDPTPNSTTDEPATPSSTPSATASPSSVPSNATANLTADRTSEKNDRNAPERPPGAPTNADDSSPASEAESGTTAAPAKADRPKAHFTALTTRLSPWALRLTDDSILPTEPIRSGEKDTTEALRARLLQLRKKQRPETLAHPILRCGYSIDLPSGKARSRWQVVAEAPGVELTLVNEHAEISWLGPAPVTACEYRLLGVEGEELASFRADAKGTNRIQTALQVRRHFWVGIERASPDRAKVTVTEWADHFSWDRQPGSSVQIQWKRDLRWLAGKGDRIDFNGEVANGQPSLVWLTYRDRATGWALLGEVEQTSEPVGETK